MENKEEKEFEDDNKDDEILSLLCEMSKHLMDMMDEIGRVTDPQFSGCGRKRFHIPLGSGRPQRDKVISKDEIMDLEIELGLCKDVDQFINFIGIPNGL